jgi:probable HAF family extracellular repeat protein
VNRSTTIEQQTRYELAQGNDQTFAGTISALAHRTPGGLTAAKHALGVRVGVSFFYKSGLRGLESIERTYVMKMYLVALVSTALLAIGTIAPAVSSSAQTYTIQDLGLAPGTTHPLGIGLNDVGQACGFCESPNGPVATFSSDGQVTVLDPTRPNAIATAKGIDNSGDVVGYELPDKAPVNSERALIWRNGGKAQDITSTSIFPGGEAALAVNKVGEVVGIGFTSAPINNETHMFTYANGQTVDLGPSTANVEPIAINDSGVMLVNITNGEQAIYFNGTFTPIAQLPNATVTANAINNSGVVVGEISYNTNTLVPHAGLYSNGVWTDLGTLSGAARGTRAVSINSSGQIIGLAEGKPIYRPVSTIPTMSCILQNGTWVELNSLIPTNSGFNLNLSVPVSINDAGQILIDIKTASGNYIRNVLLTPK